MDAAHRAGLELETLVQKYREWGTDMVKEKEKFVEWGRDVLQANEELTNANMELQLRLKRRTPRSRLELPP